MKNGRLYCKYISYPIKENINPPKCFKCLRYGHVQKHCMTTNFICNNCSKPGHASALCPEEKHINFCAICKIKEKRHNHKQFSEECTEHKNAIRQHIESIDYGN